MSIQNLIDTLVPHKLREEEANQMLQSIADSQKEEVLPNVYECRKCGEQMKEEGVNPETKQGLCGYCAR